MQVGGYQLLGVGRRSGAGLYFGSTAAHLLEACKRSLRLVSK